MLIARLPAATIKETDGSLVHGQGINGGFCEALTEAKGLPAQFGFFPVFPCCQPVSMLVIKQRASLFPPETPLVKLTDFLLQLFVLSISEDVCLRRKRRSSRSFRKLLGMPSDRVISFTQRVCLASIRMSFMLPTHTA